MGTLRAQVQMLTQGEVSKAGVLYIDRDFEQHQLPSSAGSVVGRAFWNALLTYQDAPVFTVSTLAALAQEEENNSDRIQEW